MPPPRIFPTIFRKWRGGTAEVSDNIAGVNQAADQTGAAANQVLAAAGDLGRQADDLRSNVNHFFDNMREA